MKMSEGVEWGMHCVVMLANAPEGVTLRGRTLAEYHGISETYLVKHLQALVSAGIIESTSGPKGGYRLVRAAENITLLEIVEAIDGREPAFRCTEIRQRGPVCGEAEAYRLPCTIHAAMLRAEKQWRASLRSQTIADIVSEMNLHIDEPYRQRTDTWLEGHIRRPGEVS